MTEVMRLISRLERINGIESYLLTDRNSDILAHNMSNPDDLAAMVIFGGTGAEAIMPAIGCNHFRYLVFDRMDQRNFLIFSSGEFRLGIQQITGTDYQSMADEIIHFLEERSTGRQEG